MAGKITEYSNSRTTYVDGDLFDVSAFLNPGYESQKTTWLDFKNNLNSAGYLTSVDLSYTASTRTVGNTGGNDAVLPLFTDVDAGLVPLSGGGTTNFLRADGTWAAAGGADTNIIDTNSLTATANRTHDLATFNMTFNNVGLWTINGNTSINGDLSFLASGNQIKFAAADYQIGLGTQRITYKVATDRSHVFNIGTDEKVRINQHGLGLGNSITADATYQFINSGKSDFRDRIDTDFNGQQILFANSAAIGIGVTTGRYEFTCTTTADFVFGSGASGAMTDLLVLDGAGTGLDLKSGVYKANGTSGVASFTGAVTSITITNGIVTAIS